MAIVETTGSCGVKEQRDDLLAVLKLILPILEAVRCKSQMDRIAKAKAAISKATGQ